MPRPTWSDLSLPLHIYRLATRLLQPLLPAILDGRAREGKEDPEGRDQRLGRYPAPLPEAWRIWLHGASVGEGLSILPLAEALLTANSRVQLVITTGTVTSARLLRERLKSAIFDGRVTHAYVPLDTPSAVAGFLDYWNPGLAIFTEGDLWPNMLMDLHKRSVPTALVSARMTRRSLNGWARFPATARELFGSFALILAQDDEIARRLSQLGGRDDGRLNLKLSAGTPDCDTQALERLREGLGHRPVLLAASTHQGEEDVVLEAFSKLALPSEVGTSPLLILAPRHPDRADEIESLIRSTGLTMARRSRQEPPWSCQVYLADTMGEMGLWFRLARGTFLGGSLVEGPGGHNPVEPALLAQPVATGPHLQNWVQVFEILRSAGGLIEIGNRADLVRAFEQMLDGQAVQIGLSARSALRVQSDLEPVARKLLALCTS